MFTSSAISLSVVKISVKSGLWRGLCCQHFSSSCASLGFVPFGITGLKPYKMKCSQFTYLSMMVNLRSGNNFVCSTSNLKMLKYLQCIINIHG